MEDFVLVALAAELRPHLIGLTLETVQQVGMTELVLTAARGPRRIVHLFISLAPAEPKVYEIDDRRRAALQAQETPFTARLMKAIADSEIKELTKRPYDRVLEITLANPYQAPGTLYRLYLELITQGANLFLTDAEDGVLEAFHSDFDRRRALTHGSRYTPRRLPAQIELPPATEAAFYERMGDLSQPARTWPQTLTKSFLGLSPTIAKEIAARAGEDWKQLWPAFREVIAAIYEKAPDPRIYKAPPASTGAAPGERPEPDRVLSTIALTDYRPWSVTCFPTVNEAVLTYYETLAESRTYHQLTAQLRQTVAARRAKLERLLKHLVQSREEFSQAEALKLKGELLLANLYILQAKFRIDPHGEPMTVAVENYYVDPPALLDIALDPKISLQANAEHYFQQYRRAKRGAQTLEKKIPPVRAELDRLRQYENDIGAARTVSDLQALAAKRTPSKPVRHRRIEIHKSKRQVDEISVRRFETSDQLEVLVGRNNRQNDQLTFRIAAPHDVWLHAADYPGSHVVLRNPQKIAVPERSIREAAQIAAYYSQARKNGKVTVHHTLRKFVHKPKNAAPGLVTLSQFKSVTVEPKKAIYTRSPEPEA